MRPIDLFNFKKHGQCEWIGRKRPRDYLFSARHIYLSAEEFLAELKAAQSVPTTKDVMTCRRVLGDTKPWPRVSETMEHFVRLFKEARADRDGDGFYPWRRLGFAFWEPDKLRDAGLMHDISQDRTLDRVRWLSIIREEEFPHIQNHRLKIYDSDRANDPDYEYPADTDESWSP